MKRPHISIAIPTSDMHSKQYFFKRSLEALWGQSFQDFEIVVTDNSEDDVIKDICEYYSTGIKYFRNPRKGMAQNTNEAIKQSTGKLIKILYLDDFLNHENALQHIVDSFKGHWLVTDCVHYDCTKYFNHHTPKYTDDIKRGINTIGSPSVLTIKNDDPMLFDEEMTWELDCDLYYRMFTKYGDPVVLNDRNVAIGIGEHQMSNILTDEQKTNEHQYMQKKYEKD